MRICFVLAHQQNHFFAELVAALADELEQLGVEHRTIFGAYPEPDPDEVYVLVPPHEYFQLTPPDFHPSREQLARTVFLCCEQPGSWFFDRNVWLAHQGCGAVFDISLQATDDFRRSGIEAENFPLGWTRGWSHADPSSETVESVAANRTIDVLHLGISTPRREAILAQAAPRLRAHRTRLILGDATGTAQIGRGAYLGDDHKWELLRRTRVLLNIHQDDRLYFETLRAVQAISCGVLVISETSSAIEPLRASEHLLLGHFRHLGLLADQMLRDEPARLEIAQRAERFLREERRMSTAVARLVEVAGNLRASTPTPPEPRSTALEMKPPHALTPAEVGEEVAQRNIGLAHSFPASDADALSHFRYATAVTLKDQRLLLDQLRREIARLSATVHSGAPIPRVRREYATPSYAIARPRVSVIVALYNYERYIGAALSSAAESRDTEVEIIVVDDGSTDRSLAAARAWMQDHPAVPAILLQHPVNRSLGPARNAAIGAARGEFTFVLDADNVVYPKGIPRLVNALDGDDDASFAYGPLAQTRREGGAVGLVSQFPWQPWRFRNGNYIDAMVLWRTAALRELGGFTTDLRMFGWEDYDLFCRVAEQDRRGVFHPEVVAEYTVSDTSMLQTTNISPHAAINVLIERHPRLLGDVLRRARSV